MTAGASEYTTRCTSGSSSGSATFRVESLRGIRLGKQERQILLSDWWGEQPKGRAGHETRRRAMRRLESLGLVVCSLRNYIASGRRSSLDAELTPAGRAVREVLEAEVRDPREDRIRWERLIPEIGRRLAGAAMTS